MFRTLLLAIALAIPISAEAQDKDIMLRLQTEPVTLFDWGMAQLDRDIQRVAGETITARPGLGEVSSGALYSRRTRQITLLVSAPLPRAERDERNCRRIYATLISRLLHGAPGGSGAAGWYLLNTFQPRGHFLGNRFEDVGSKLLNFVRLEVALIPAVFQAQRGDSRQVRCSGRLDSRPSDIKTKVSS